MTENGNASIKDVVKRLDQFIENADEYKALCENRFAKLKGHIKAGRTKKALALAESLRLFAGALVEDRIISLRQSRARSVAFAEQVAKKEASEAEEASDAPNGHRM